MADHPRYIIIVEDEVLVAMHTCRMLERAGYRVAEPVTNGPDAISLIRSEHPDLLIIDVHLPGVMDGVEIAQSIRTDLETPIIFMTGYSDAETRRRAQQVNPIAILEKPVLTHQLETAIALALKA
jgi:CheY-like chemotaxis protein